MRFTIDAAPLAAAMKLIAAGAAKPDRRDVDILQCALIEAANGALRLLSTTLDSSVSVSLPCEVAEAGAIAVPALELAAMARGAAKARGAAIEASLDETGRLALASGRSRVAICGKPAADYPAAVLRPLGDDAETWQASPAEAAEHGAEGLELSADSLKLLAKALKYAGAESVTIARQAAPGANGKLRIEADNVAYLATLAAPQLARWKPQREPFTYGHDSSAEAEAAAYLRSLRRSLDLPCIADRDGAAHTGRLVVHNGRAVGMTFGEGRSDYPETREMGPDWRPPEGTAIEDGECQIDGVRYWNARERVGPGCEDVWCMSYRPERHGAIVYPDGAYSLPMPADQRRAIASITVDVDGETIPLRYRGKAYDNTTGALELSAEAVRDLCGPVDPSTFVEIPALAFHHGRLIARGPAAVEFNRLQAESFKRQRKAAKAGVTYADRAPMIAAEVAAFAPVIAAAINGADVMDASIAALGGLPREAPAAVEAPEPVADMPEPIAQGDAPEREPIAEDVAEAPQPAAAANVAARLARIEAALGLADHPRRSPQHGTAIRRAWAMRRRMRERADLDRRALLQVGSYNRIMREENARLTERLGRIESQVKDQLAERSEMIARMDRMREALNREADGLQHNATQAARYVTGKDRMARRAAKLRNELARTRAERDGMAANVQALSRRLAADAERLERLAPADAGPRIILSSRF